MIIINDVSTSTYYYSRSYRAKKAAKPASAQTLLELPKHFSMLNRATKTAWIAGKLSKGGAEKAFPGDHLSFHLTSKTLHPKPHLPPTSQTVRQVLFACLIRAK